MHTHARTHTHTHTRTHTHAHTHTHIHTRIHTLALIFDSQNAVTHIEAPSHIKVVSCVGSKLFHLKI